MVRPPRLILVHSPLVGPATWQPAARLLRGRFEVSVPSLDGIAAGPGPYAEQFAEAVRRSVLRSGGTDPVVLVGHSGAGAYLPYIAAHLAHSDHHRTDVLGTAFVDAQLPRPGLSDFDASGPEFAESMAAMARDDVVPPWNQWFPPELVVELLPDAEQREAFIAELRPIALSYFREPIPNTVSLSKTECLYLRLSDAYKEQADQAAALGWTVARFPGHHLTPFTDPEPVAAFLSEFALSLANR